MLVVKTYEQVLFLFFLFLLLQYREKVQPTDLERRRRRKNERCVLKHDFRREENIPEKSG